MNRPDYLFLIGGSDLEMVTIKRLLTANGFADGQNIADHHLQWGAKLSNYQDLFNDTRTFVGIELTRDIPPPSHYIEIDHHNENSHKSSSLEQVIDLLKKDLGIEIEFTRELQLIAANDKGYIPAMLELKATKEEIADIRQRDRKAQGVTAEDEQLAEQSIRENCTQEGGITVVKSLTSKFSAITDRIYPCPKLLIYTDQELTFYGEGASLLNSAFSELVKQNLAYSGGGENGFFGISALSENYTEMRELAQSIINILAMKSFHCFMFPFKWDIIDRPCKKVEELDFKLRMDLSRFHEEISKSKWKRDGFELSKSEMAYNEFVYYHDFVRKVIFDEKEAVEDCTEKKNNKDDIMHHYRYPIEEGAYYEIEIVQVKSNNKLVPPRPKYKLKLAGVNLHVYKTGVGVVAFDLENYEYKDPKDILAINEYGRRIYPQFLGDNEGLKAVKKAFLADSIKVCYDGKTAIKENFRNYDKRKFSNKIRASNPFLLPRFLKKIFKEASFGYENLDSKDKNPQSKKGLFFSHVTDDRMFSLCWYGNDGLAKKLGTCLKNKYKYEKNNWWYCYLFGDKNSPSVENEWMKKDQINFHTYNRWANFGTLFGLTRDTFVAVSSENLTLNAFNAPPLANHIQTIYYQMVLLGLVQRASVLKFSAEVSNLANLTSDDDKFKELQIKVEQLYSNYIEFINKIYFREVTSQIQGIELYQLLQKVMNIEKDVTNLDNEITELHSYISMINDKKRNDHSDWLNKMALWFLPASLVTGILGIGFIGTDSKIIWSSWLETEVWKALILIFCTGVSVSLLLHWWLNNWAIPKRLRRRKGKN